MKRPLDDEGDESDRNPIVFLDVAIGDEKGMKIHNKIEKQIHRETTLFDTSFVTSH